MLVVSSILTALISPLGCGLTLGIVALILGLQRWRRTALTIGTVALAWLWAWSLPVVANWISAHVSRDYPPMASDRSIDQLPEAGAIVLLGGGVNPATAKRTSPDLGEASDRIWMAAKLWHAKRAPVIVASGGHDPHVHVQSEAEAMRDVLVALGVPEQAIILEDQSRNTRQNAKATSQLLGSRNIRKILLVTSASHMKRALSHFGETGLEVVAVATDHQSIDFSDLRRFIPQAQALDLSARSLKEWVGQRVW